MNKDNLTPEMIVMLDMSRMKFIEVNKEYLKTLGMEYYDLTDKNGEIQTLSCPLLIIRFGNPIWMTKQIFDRTAF